MQTQTSTKSSQSATAPCCSDSFYDNPCLDAKLDKDLEFAINCLEASNDNPIAVAEARSAIMRGDGVLSLMDKLAELYAEAGVAGVGLPRRMTQPHVAHHEIAKAIEHAYECDCTKKKANDNDTSTERSDYLFTPENREIVMCVA